MVNVRQTIVIKTDRLNADDLIGGATRTITVAGAKIVSDPAQPFAISFQGDGGKPYYPCLSMRKLLMDCWGEETDGWIGHSMTLVRDDKVKYGKDEVGGLRITHMTHIPKDTTLALTVTRGIKKPYTVKVLRVVPGVAVSAEEARTMLETAANDGSAALRDMWTSLPAATRKAVSPTGCPPELKTIAEGIDADRAAALAAKSDLADALAGDNGDGETDEAES
jgi:hypothetical protein